MKSWSTGKKIRRGIVAAICLLLIIVGHVAGVFLAVGFVAICALPVLWIKIFKGGTRYIARTHAEEIEKARQRGEQERQQSGL